MLVSDEGHRKEVAKGFRKTTNNRMELLSVIVGLELIKAKPMDVVVFSDSKYVVDAVEKNGFLDGKNRCSTKRKIPICGYVFYRFIGNIMFVLFGLKDITTT